MTKQNLCLEKVFEVYGYDLPESRGLYSATTKSPVSTLNITKRFKTWNKFRLAYLAFCAEKRAEAAKTVTKAPVVKKKVEADNGRKNDTE